MLREGEYSEAIKLALCKKKATPFKLEKSKRYMLCNCGKSSKLPLCDGSHRRDPERDIKPSAYDSLLNKKAYFCGCCKSKDMVICKYMKNSTVRFVK